MVVKREVAAAAVSCCGPPSVYLRLPFAQKCRSQDDDEEDLVHKKGDVNAAIAGKCSVAAFSVKNCPNVVSEVQVEKKKHNSVCICSSFLT